MIKSLRKTNAFQNDIARYNAIITKLPEGDKKNEISHLLSNLIQEVKKMDDLHMEFVYNKQMNSLGSEFRQRIFNHRKNLENKIKEYNLHL